MDFAQFSQLDIPILCNEPLSRHTSFAIGGPADMLAVPRNAGEMALLLHAAGALPVHIIGNGTNLLAKDDGVRGLVVKTAGLDVLTIDGCTVTVSCGVMLSQLCRAAQRAGLSGLEFAYGIPGTSGGAVYMNAGAYGGEMSHIVRTVTAYDRASGAMLTLSGDEMAFGYRRSVFVKHPDWVIINAELSLKPDDPADIDGRMTELMTRRRATQPLEYPSAGSVFKRPDGQYAGTLIEQCGLKGRAVGGAMVSKKHAGFIINTGGATCRDVLELIQIIQTTVQAQCGITLEPEIQTL